MWVYQQSTGVLQDGLGRVIAIGYSGNGPGLNDPRMANVPDVGPLPVGLYTMDEPILDDPKLGRYVIPLIPDSSNEMFGRSGFFCHGDNVAEDHSASEGCIVMEPEGIRIRMWTSGDRRVAVTPGPVPRSG